MVLGAGVEPAQPCGHQALNLACLPFHHPSIPMENREKLLPAPVQSKVIFPDTAGGPFPAARRGNRDQACSAFFSFAVRSRRLRAFAGH